MKIDEYAPVIKPMNSASPKYCSVVAPNTYAPMNSTDATGSTATSDVLRDLAITWFIDRLTVLAYVIRPEAPRPLAFSWTRSNTTIVS